MNVEATPKFDSFNRAILKAVLSLLSDETRWTKKCFARDGSGNECLANDEHASCWCVSGAVFREVSKVIPIGPHETEQCDGQYEGACTDITKAILSKIDAGRFIHVVTWNDDPSTCHKDVMSVISKAIEECDAGLPNVRHVLPLLDSMGDRPKARHVLQPRREAQRWLAPWQVLRVRVRSGHVGTILL